MCGLAGFTFAAGAALRARYAPSLARMTASLAHRGPDDLAGVVVDGAALGHARLSIVDRAGGAQPMRDERTGALLVFNGEIYDCDARRAALAGRWSFRTRSDTEVLLASLVVDGARALAALEGQFAFALWEPRARTLTLARDRFGIQPLFWAPIVVDGAPGVAFASEAKALFASALVDAALDPHGVHQALTTWSVAAPRTAWRGVHELPAGHCARVVDGRVDVARWAPPTLAAPRDEDDDDGARLRDALTRAVRRRLVADVPVGAYLSGGIDSSVVCALAQKATGGALRTFSVAFRDAAYDERAHQERVAAALSTRHTVVEIGDDEVAALLPEVVRLAERPLLRAAPAPFLRLSRAARDDGVKVVLTGEGADEMLLCYDLFRETKVRAFCARAPSSTMRPALLARLYPWLHGHERRPALLSSIYGVGVDDPTHPLFSHLVRFRQSSRIARFFAADFAARLDGDGPTRALVDAMPRAIRDADPLARAQWLETTTLLSGYLLAAQGDRMLLGHGVEGRFPYLDGDVVDACARIPAHRKLRGLNEKAPLKRLARDLVPPDVVARRKFPYRAPVARALVGPRAPGWARELLAPFALRDAGFFDPDVVGKLVAKLASSTGAPSEADQSALVGIATTQLSWFGARALGVVDEARVARVRVEVA